MEIKTEELNHYKTYVIYKEGYRIVYYYEKYHEVPKGLYAKNLEAFIDFFEENGKKLKFTNIDDILNRFLEKKPEALGVAIYNVNQKCIAKKIKNNVNNVNDSTVYKEELIYDYNTVIAKEGYRIVYFYPDGTYYIGTYAKNIEDFMIEFCDYYPIMDDSDVPEFISVDDLLNKYLDKLSDISGVALYKIDGVCLQKKTKCIKK
mgnify:FL=1